ncbi:hypothetical protein GEMRC1_003640 [Eukaryota sp. GEM-RC1]
MLALFFTCIVLVHCSFLLHSYGDHHLRIGRADDGSSTQTPHPFAYLDKPIVKVTTSHSSRTARTSAAITDDGDLLLWGARSRPFFYNRSDASLPEVVNHISEPVIDIAFTSEPFPPFLTAIGESGRIYKVDDDAVSIIPTSVPMKAVSSGHEHSLFISHDGRVFASSIESSSASIGGCRAMGVGHSTCNGDYPLQEVTYFSDLFTSTNSTATQIIASRHGSYVLTSLGHVYVFGRGAIGLRRADWLDYPTRLFAGISTKHVIKISVYESVDTDRLGLALTKDGLVYTWQGETSNYNSLPRTQPPSDQIPEFASMTDQVNPFLVEFDDAHDVTFVDVASGGCGGLLLSSAGDVYNFGHDKCLVSGQSATRSPNKIALSFEVTHLDSVDNAFFLYTRTPQPIPEYVSPVSPRFMSFGGPAGRNVVNIGRFAWSWVSMTSTINANAGHFPVSINSDVRFVKISSSFLFTFAIDDQGKLFSWSDNSDLSNFLYRDSSFEPLHTPDLCFFPRHLSFPNKDFYDVAVSQSSYTSALFVIVENNDRQLFSWGYGSTLRDDSQFYLGRTGSHSVPRVVSPDTLGYVNITLLACSPASTFLLDHLGDVWSYGRGFIGREDVQGGWSRNVGDFVARKVSVPGGRRVIDIQCAETMCGLLTENAYLVTFGSSLVGREVSQLNNEHFKPGVVSGRYLSISLNSNALLAINSDHKAVSWGSSDRFIGRKSQSATARARPNLIEAPSSFKVGNVFSTGTGGFLLSSDKILVFGDDKVTGLGREVAIPEPFNVREMNLIKRIHGGCSKVYLERGLFDEYGPRATVSSSALSLMLWSVVVILLAALSVVGLLSCKIIPYPSWCVGKKSGDSARERYKNKKRRPRQQAARHVIVQNPVHATAPVYHRADENIYVNPMNNACQPPPVFYPNQHAV